MNRAQWGLSEQGEVGMFWTGSCGDVLNRVLWGCYEQGAVGMLWRRWWTFDFQAKFTTSPDTAVSESLGCAVSSVRRYLTLKEENLMFRVGCQCWECAVLVHLQEIHRNWCRHENYANCSTLHHEKGWGCGMIFKLRGDLQAVGDESV